MLRERVWRAVKEPVLLMVGIRNAPVGSELAKSDFRELLSKAKCLVRYAGEQVEEPNLLFGLVDRKVKLELIVGKSQDPMIIARLQSKGADMVAVWRSEQEIPSPFVIVDGTHTLRYDPGNETIPDRAKPRTQTIVLNDDFTANTSDSRFEELRSSSTR